MLLDILPYSTYMFRLTPAVTKKLFPTFQAVIFKKFFSCWQTIYKEASQRKPFIGITRSIGQCGF